MIPFLQVCETINSRCTPLANVPVRCRFFLQRKGLQDSPCPLPKVACAASENPKSDLAGLRQVCFFQSSSFIFLRFRCRLPFVTRGLDVRFHRVSFSAANHNRKLHVLVDSDSQPSDWMHVPCDGTCSDSVTAITSPRGIFPDIVHDLALLTTDVGWMVLAQWPVLQGIITDCRSCDRATSSIAFFTRRRPASTRIILFAIAGLGLSLAATSCSFKTALDSHSFRQGARHESRRLFSRRICSVLCKLVQLVRSHCPL